MENGLDEAHSMVEEAVDTVVGKYELARGRGLELTGSVRGAVAERPLTSLGIAVGAGAVAGWLLRR